MSPKDPECDSSSASIASTVAIFQIFTIYANNANFFKCTQARPADPIHSIHSTASLVAMCLSALTDTVLDLLAQGYDGAGAMCTLSFTMYPETREHWVIYHALNAVIDPNDDYLPWAARKARIDGALPVLVQYDVPARRDRVAGIVAMFSKWTLHQLEIVGFSMAHSHAHDVL
jgi:hypothetical protein